MQERICKRNSASQISSYFAQAHVITSHDKWPLSLPRSQHCYCYRKYCGPCKAPKFMWLIWFLLSLQQLQSFAQICVYFWTVFSCPRRINIKLNLHLMLLKVGRFLKHLSLFFFLAVLILRPHSLEISMSLAWVVGISCRNPQLLCQACALPLLEDFEISNFHFYSCSQAGKTLRIGGKPPVLSSVALIYCLVYYFVIKPKAQINSLEMQQLQNTKRFSSQKLLMVFETAGHCLRERS